MELYMVIDTPDSYEDLHTRRIWGSMFRFIWMKGKKQPWSAGRLGYASDTWSCSEHVQGRLFTDCSDWTPFSLKRVSLKHCFLRLGLHCDECERCVIVEILFSLRAGPSLRVYPPTPSSYFKVLDIEHRELIVEQSIFCRHCETIGLNTVTR